MVNNNGETSLKKRKTIFMKKNFIHFKFKPLNDHGYNLVEIVLAMAVSAIVLGGVISTLNVVTSGSAQYNLLQARNEVLNKIRIQAMNPANLVASAQMTDSLGAAGVSPDYGPESSLLRPDLLKKCLPDIKDTESFGCNKAEFEEPGKGYLFYLAENASISPEKAVAGEDIYYRNTGMRCPQKDAEKPESCPLMARVWFEPFCMNFATSCTKAMSLALRYSIGLRPDFKTDLAVPSISGEFYVPLQKGIQLRNLLSDLDSPILPNSKGLFIVEKFYGHPGQSVKGLRFETLISNPYGLLSMRLQMRSLTGSEAKMYDDSVIPEDLLAKSWTDMPTPENEGMGSWAVNLSGAYPNQVFNFGTQINPGANSRSIPTAFKIGSDNIPLDPKYRWTLNESQSDYLAPAFKSGFYQFRVLASDALGGEMESTNYITVRLVSIPEYQYVNPNFTLDRDCQSSAESFSIFVGDDESMTFRSLKINNQNYPINTSPQAKDRIDFIFQKNQPAASYPVTITIKNRFSDAPLENNFIPRVERTQVINLTDIPASTNPGISHDPLTMKINAHGNVTVQFSAGNCCDATPKVEWSYLCSTYFTGGVAALCASGTGLSLLSGPNTSQMNCSVSGNTRSCSSTISVKAEGYSPSMTTPPANIKAAVDVHSSASACALTPTATSLSKHVPIVNLPNIYFYLTESLWLDLPAGPATSSTPALEAVVPRVVVRSDFPPTVSVQVNVLNAETSQVYCTLDFPASTSSTTPIDRFCTNIPTNFSGQLILQKAPSSSHLIKTEIDLTQASHVARLEGNITHQFCRSGITHLLDQPAKYTVPATIPMNDTPYSYTVVDGSIIQDSKNDTGQWLAGRQKSLRCYDGWTNYSPSSYPHHKQDFYDVFNYNNSNSSKRNNSFQLSFATFEFPSNPPINIDKSTANSPYIFMVLQEGSPGTIRWSYSVSSSGDKSAASSEAQSWEIITPQVCSGSSSLNKIKLLRTRVSVETGNPNVIMKAVNSGASVGMVNHGYYSYLFMCNYGRWHPSGKSYNNWID